MYKEISVKDVKENLVKLIASDWALLTAGNENGFNTMTVSWGSVGELWGKDMATVYVRPQRYTKKYIDSNEYFTLTFYNDDDKNILSFCGSHSGKDVDKVKETGLVPIFDEKAPYIKQAKLVLICKKMAVSRFKQEDFLDSSIMNNYADNDFHEIYYGAIEKVLISAE